MRHRNASWLSIVTAVLLSWTLAPGQVRAQVPYLVKDINTTAATSSSNPLNFGSLGSELYFMATSAAHGAELWKSDGTDAGTVLVRDIVSGATGSGPQRLVSVNGTLFFVATDGTSGTELWKTDGTVAGTVMVRDIYPGTSSSNPMYLTAFNGTLFFTANDGTTGVELWRSDGTAAGTVLVKDIAAGSAGSMSSTSFTSFNGALFFVATDAASGTELWTSDGTAAGTVLFKDILPGSGSSGPGSLTDAGGALYFAATDGVAGGELWKSDGTPGGTTMVKDINPGSGWSSPVNLVGSGSTVLFRASDGTTGQELWRSDGSAAGTVLVKDIYPGPSSSMLTGWTDISGLMLFQADDGTSGAELWVTDGTSAGTVLVKDIRPGAPASTPHAFVSLNGTVLFNATDAALGTELWRTDGTAGGTVMVKDIYSGAGGGVPQSHTDVNGTLYFSAQTAAHGRELWKSDGTEAGTVMVKDILGANGSLPGNLVTFNEGLLLKATDTAGSELWKSDGTEAGTVLVKDVYAGSGQGNPSVPVAVGSQVFFAATDAASGRELWKSDATSAGTVLVKDILAGSSSSNPANFASVGGTLFFQGYDTTNGAELWKSDGTAAGTVLVKDIRAGSSHSLPSYLTNVNGTLYFVADDGANGAELWKSDGTSAGTVLVKDINTGLTGSTASNLLDVNGTLFLVANDGVNGPELWKSNGTSAGTVLVKNIYTGATGSSPSNLANINGTLYFSANDGTNGVEPWRSNGTAAGTVMVKNIRPLSANSSPAGFTLVNGSVFFKAEDGTAGVELWKTDGTAAGTVMVKDVRVGNQSSNPSYLTSVNGMLMFAADDGVNGLELWKSDGTAVGTVLLPEVIAGAAGSSPQDLTVVGDGVFFTADDIGHGRELWAVCVGTFYPDADSDGFGNAAFSTQACTAPSGYVANASDCDDSDDTVYPGAPELCDGKDNDCDGQADEPAFAGLTSATPLGGGECGIRLDWPAVSACSGNAVFSVYRSTSSGFAPGAGTLLASCVAQRFFIDTAVGAGTPYYYVVRAENPSTGGAGPCYGGGQEANLVEKTATATACTAAAGDVVYLTARASNTSVRLEWLNPSSSYAYTRACIKASGYPSGPTDAGATCTDHAGAAGAYGTTTFSSLPNGTEQFFAAWVWSGSEWSGGRYTRGRPFDTSVAGKWAYSSAATTLAPAGVRPNVASYTASNDRILHAMTAGSSGGVWPAGWIPASMNAPAQARPSLATFPTLTIGGTSSVALVGAQDGRVYAFSSLTGALLWASPVLGDAVQAGPSIVSTDFGGSANLALVATRTPGGDSRVYGLNLSDGTVAWTFDNGGGANGMGIVSGQLSAEPSTSRLWVTSRAKPGGSSDTVWCLSFTGSSATKVWSRALGDADAATTLRNGRLYVGTNAGTVHALDPVTGSDLWGAPYATADGAVKSFVWVQVAGPATRLYLATTTKVHALDDLGGSPAALWPAYSTGAPSQVLVISGNLYVGTSSGNGQLLRLDALTGSLLGSVTLGDPALGKTVGAPSFDTSAGQVIAGTDEGAVYAVSAPF